MPTSFRFKSTTLRFETPEIMPDEVEVEKELGSGAFGVVFKGKCRGINVAIKVVIREVAYIESI